MKYVSLLRSTVTQWPVGLRRSRHIEDALHSDSGVPETLPMVTHAGRIVELRVYRRISESIPSVQHPIGTVSQPRLMGGGFSHNPFDARSATAYTYTEI